MPKLSKDIAKKASKAESKGGSREPMPEGDYRVRLLEVEAKESSNGNPMWNWKYEVVEGDHTGRFLWNNTTLVDSAMWAVNQTFEAFGVPTDTDTDDLIGEEVGVSVSIGTVGAGANQGKKRNNVESVFPASQLNGGDGDDAKSEKKGKKGKDGKKGKKKDGDSPW